MNLRSDAGLGGLVLPFAWRRLVTGSGQTLDCTDLGANVHIEKLCNRSCKQKHAG